MIEELVKRTIFVSECTECGEKDIRESNPPRERFCTKCKKWAKYEKFEWIGKGKFDK